MADRGGSSQMGPRLDIEQLQLEAQHRWLRPAEICEILSNYRMFQITSESPTRPPSGSLFLFDRKVLRYFRKDGHNWRKKKDGKTVKEAHEKLKMGSVDVLHCYYAHGEENETFQRRSYWMLEPDMMHIVFVHYLEVKGNKTYNGGKQEIDDVTSDSKKNGALAAGSPTNHSAAASGSTDSMSPTSTLTSLCEEADSEDIHQASSRFHSVSGSPEILNGPVMDKTYAGLRNSYFPHPSSDYVQYVEGGKFQGSVNCTNANVGQKENCVESCETILEQYTTEFHGEPPAKLHSSNQIASVENILEQEQRVLGNHLMERSISTENFRAFHSIEQNWQRTHDCLGIAPLLYSKPGQTNVVPVQQNFPRQQINDKSFGELNSSSENENIPEAESINHAVTAKRMLLNGEESLQKVDSFSRWIAKELEEVEDLHMQSSSDISWSTVDCGNVIDDSSLCPSLSRDQLFSITDFSPKWTYAEYDTKPMIFVIGTFLKNEQEVANCNWSCMFGEVEVPAEVIGDAVLICQAPPHKVGQVPFYVTCSNRLACSEIREFNYREGCLEKIDVTDAYSGSTSELLLHSRLVRLLSLKSGNITKSNHTFNGDLEKKNLIHKLILLKEEENSREDPTLEMELSHHRVKGHLQQKQAEEKLYSWLLRKVTEDGKGPSVLDEEGQGILHLAASLGYDWAIKPTVTAGVSINFRDVNGWTALHWAASCGREQTVGVLVSLGAAPGALTDPCPAYPLGRTPADLASGNGHKGISGFLAEISLTSHLQTLTMGDSHKDGEQEAFGVKAVQSVSGWTATPALYGDVPDVLCLKDSLKAVCNATQAADRIYQVFRMQSFQRRRLIEYGDDEFALSDQGVLSLLTSKTGRAAQGDGLAHAAAVQIQKKFRGWKNRKEFLIIRQRIVKIQAHVRGHQVRKKYKSIIWSVGIVEKVILRWRRKGSGLRGFRPDALKKDPSHQSAPSIEDDYDFFKEGRKQTEERLQKALSRVKSMVHYPEARAQYRRLVNVVEGYQENKACNMDLVSSEEKLGIGDDLIDIDMLLDDVNFMPVAFDSLQQ